MQEQSFRELEDRASLASHFDEVMALETRSRVKREIALMKEEGKALELSEEEENMLRSFRRFKLRMRKDGEVFTWQTRRPSGVVIAEDTAEIIHPSEVASDAR